MLQQLKKKERLKKELTLTALRKRSLIKHWNTQFTKKSKEYKEFLEFSSDLFLHQYQISKEEELFKNALNQRKPKENQEESILRLDLYYIVEKLRNICEVNNSKTIFETDGQHHLNDEVLQLAQTPPFNTYPQVQIYMRLLDTITQSDNDASFYALQQLIQDNGHLLSEYEEREIYLALINFCIRKINQGSQKSLEECFELYKNMYEKDLLVSGQYLSPWTYKNIITAALRLDELDWTSEFIKGNYQQLSPEHRENAYNYNLAKYNFHIGEYNKVLDLLQKVEYDDIFYGLDARTLLMKVYYDLNEEEALYSLTDSFRVYLRRKKKIPKERRKTYLNFIKFIRRLIMLSPRDIKNLNVLESRIQQADRVADKAWILEKLSQKAEKMKLLKR